MEKSTGHLAFSQDEKWEYFVYGKNVYKAPTESILMATDEESHRTHAKFVGTLAWWKSWGDKFHEIGIFLKEE